MPEKLGNGGNGLEQYDQNTGKYTADGQPNKYYNNPAERYDSSGLISTVKKKISESTGKEFFEDIEQKFYDEELAAFLSDEIADYDITFKKITYGPSNVRPSFGKSYVIELNQGYKYIGLDDELSAFSKNETLTHELGHAVDYIFDPEEIEDYYLSSTFVSPKYNQTLSDMVLSEIKQNVNFDNLKEEYGALVEEQKKQNGYLSKEEQQSKIEEFNDKLNIVRDPIYHSSKYEQLTSEIMDLRSQIEELQFLQMMNWHGKNNTEEDLKKHDQLEQQVKQIEDVVVSKATEKEAYYQEQIQKTEYNNLQQEKEQFLQQQTYLLEKSRTHVDIKYGNLSDMCEAVFGQRLRFGHGEDYWRRYDNSQLATTRGTEAFAEIMSARLTNPESLELLKKYIPKTLEIFDEIIDHIKKGKANEQ